MKNLKCKKTLVFLSFLIGLIFMIKPLLASANTVNAEASNDLLEFEASIKNTDIKDGTAPFDNNNNPGYDSSEHNGIVRTFDNITYPLKVTINPKKSVSLKNIRLRISGELINGITDNRVNAVFTRGTTDMVNNKVKLYQEYTVRETGNAVSIPIVVETKGAKNGTVITPKISVTIVSAEIDGKEVSQNISVNLNNISSTKISGKVNVGVATAGLYSTEGIMKNTIYSSISKNDLSMVYGRNISFYIKPLDNKNNMVGATFPDGKLNFHLELSGRVSWDNGKQEILNFKNKNKPIKVFSYHPIVDSKTFQGKMNTVSEKLGNYVWNFSDKNNAPRSIMSDLTNYTKIISESNYSVWNSGSYSISKAQVENDKIKVYGSDKDFVIGSTFPTYRADSYYRIYGENRYTFSTQAVLIETPNEYFPKYGLNMANKANNVYYDIKLVADSYIDNCGVTHSLNTSATGTISERNNPSGAFSLDNSYYSYQGGKELGTPYPGWSAVSKGDATIIKGQDVTFRSCISSKMFSVGGFKHIIKWNPDSFEMTQEYAAQTKADYIKCSYMGFNGQNDIDTSKISVYFGVAKKQDNSFKSITSNGKDDYTWYNSYAEAIKHGVISAAMKEVKSGTGIGVISDSHTILKVKTNKIGSINYKGTPNVCASQAYMYPYGSTDDSIKVRTGGYWDFSRYDTNGKLTKLQDPVGVSINFETLGIINAEVSNSLTSDKNTYYSSDVVKFSDSSAIIAPENIQFNNAEKIIIKQVLPKGLMYNSNTAKLGDKKYEPKVSKNGDITTLTWEYYFKSNDRQIPKISFEAVINPAKLKDGNESSLTISSVIYCDLDSRSDKFRSSERTINIVKVGMAGIAESVNPDFGWKNSDYSLILNPYTTIDDEANVKGITVLPYNKDTLASSFSGDTWLKSIVVNGTTKKVDFWLNNTAISEKNPNNIDINKNGWYQYKDGVDLSKVKTVFFHINTLSKNDHFEFVYKMGTRNNQFNDIYINKTTVNSGCNYRLSPESNIVKYSIRADVELGFKKIQIFTNRADRGLLTNLIIDKVFVNDTKAKDSPITISLYEKGTKNIVISKTYPKISQIPDKIEFTIPKNYLRKDSSKFYEAVFEKYDTSCISAMKDEAHIDTEGFTSSEKHLVNTSGKDITYSGVIMTEREINKEMNVYKENLTVPSIAEIKTKSGYGVELNKFNVLYQNELKKHFDIPSRLKLQNELVEPTLNLSNSGSSYKYITLNELQSNMTEDEKTVKYKCSYNMPDVLIRKGDGAVFQTKDKVKAEAQGLKTVNGGKKLYVPIWINKLGKYHIYFESEQPIGINEVTFSLDSVINVYAYMYATMGSFTVKDDELLIEPVYPDSVKPKGWIKSELDWLKK